MSEIKTLNGYKLVDETARTEAKANAEAIAAIRQKIDRQNPLLTEKQIAAAKRFAGKFSTVTGSAESFLFFADPHFSGSQNVSDRFGPWLNQIAAVYNQTPTSMCVCAGDWLNNNNTRENACWQLGLIDGALKSRFDKYISILGNHDTNYQGYEYIQSGIEDKNYDRNECSKCQLSNEAIRALWYRRQGNAYFAVDGDCTRFYVFDSGLDWYDDMTEYRWKQVQWFAQSLLTEKPERAALLMHIATAPFANAVLQIASAYNARMAIVVHGSPYDFSDAEGVVGFALGGHEHYDYSFVRHGIPVILTANLSGRDDQPRFDLVLVDWGGKKIHLIRVGDGEDRTIELAEKQ